MLINHQSEFQSAMSDLEFLGYDVETIIPNSPYNLKDIILTLCTEYQSVAFEEGHAEGHAAGYDAGEEEGRESGYEYGFSDGKDDGDAEGYDRGFEDGQDELEELEFVGNTDEEDGVRYL
tara:strand:+ start:1783 stop:2142 length:360 start_codon:yes stop_codon:yes gene_type:complete